MNINVINRAFEDACSTNDSCRSIDRELLEQALAVVGVVSDIGSNMLHIRNSGLIQTSEKQDGSSVTNADLMSRDVFQKSLPCIVNCPILSEETGYGGGLSLASTFWNVDELDGTSSFLGGYPNFGPMVALVKEGRLSIGVAGLPAMNKVLFAVEGIGAFVFRANTNTVESIRTRDPDAEKYSIAGFFGRSESEVDLLRPDLAIAQREVIYEPVGALLKYCKVALGEVDAAGGTFGMNLHDIAGATLIVREAGGEVFDLDTKQPVIIDPSRRSLYKVLAVGRAANFKGHKHV